MVSTRRHLRSFAKYRENSSNSRAFLHRNDNPSRWPSLHEALTEQKKTFLNIDADFSFRLKLYAQSMSGRELSNVCILCCKQTATFLRKLSQRGTSSSVPKSRRFLSLDADGASVKGRGAATSGYEHMRYLVIAPLVCTALGTWQIARLKQKLEIIDNIHQRYNAEPVHISEIDLNPDSLKSAEYRRVFVRGKFQHEQEMYVDFKHPIMSEQSAPQWTLSAGSKASKGNYGAHVVTPFIVDEQDANRISSLHTNTNSGKERPLRILVNRGWVPKTQLDPLKRQSGQIEDSVTISGFIRTDEKKFLNFLIQDTPKPRTFLFRDVTAMAELCGSEAVMIELDSQSVAGVPGLNEGAPLPGQTLIQIYNKHAEYIATWYGLALVTGYLWYRHVYKAIPFSRKLFFRKMIK